MCVIFHLIFNKYVLLSFALGQKYDMILDLGISCILNSEK